MIDVFCFLDLEVQKIYNKNEIIICFFVPKFKVAQHGQLLFNFVCYDTCAIEES